MGDPTNLQQIDKYSLLDFMFLLLYQVFRTTGSPIEAQNFLIKTETCMNQLEPRAGICRGYHRKWEG